MQAVNEFFRLGAKFQKEHETQMNFWQELTTDLYMEIPVPLCIFYISLFPFSWEVCFFILCLELSLTPFMLMDRI